MPEDAYAFQTFDEYTDVVRRIYLDNKIDLESQFLSDTLPYLSKDRIDGIFTHRSKILMKCLEEYITFFLLIALKTSAYTSSDPSSYRLSIASLMSGITSMLTAIRELTSAGLILPAMQICRPLRDATNMVLLCVIDPSLADRFAKTTESKAANQFWHEYLAREKDIKAIERAVENYAGSTAALFRSSTADTDEILGMMIHPSLSGGGIAMHSDALFMFSQKPKEIQLAPKPLAYAMHQCFRLLLCGFEPAIITGKFLTDVIPEGDREFVTSLRKMLIELHLFTLTRVGRASNEMAAL